MQTRFLQNSFVVFLSPSLTNSQKNRGCKFTRFQDGRLQEMPEEVPVGHIPRSITLHFRGDMTRCSLPG